MLSWLFNNCTSAVNFSSCFQVYGDLIQYRQRACAIIECRRVWVCVLWCVRILAHAGPFASVLCADTMVIYLFSCHVNYFLVFTFSNWASESKTSRPSFAAKYKFEYFPTLQVFIAYADFKKNILRLRHATDKYCNVQYS